MISGIYKIENSISGKKYVGSAVNLKNRLCVHRHDLKNGNHHSQKLQRAWDKYGSNSFTFDVLLVCDKSNLIYYEQRAIDAFQSVANGYNVVPKAGSSLGHKLSDEQREKLRRPRGPCLALIGHPVSAETRQKIGDANRGKVRSKEVKNRMSISKIGNTNTLGFKHSAETKAKMSIARKGRKRSKETIAKMVATKAALRLQRTERGEPNG